MKLRLVALLNIISFYSYSQDSAQKAQHFNLDEYINRVNGKQFGQFEIKSSGATSFSNANLAGKVVFVNFWFAGCPPCISELEGFNRLYDTLENNRDFMFLSFTFDPDSTTQNLKDRYGIKYHVFHIERTECYRLNFNMGFPASFVLDKKGVVRYCKVGGHVDIPKSTNAIFADIYPKIIGQL
ncbi:MAG TPA: TlpA disulfide reductase family protein [Ferruginibacter sp.]|nr:TlpA disulfide reductase family protein [Ferruginibacter sp.]